MNRDYQSQSSQRSMPSSFNYYSAVERIMSHVTPKTLKEFHAIDTDQERVCYVMTLSYVNDEFDAVRPLFERKSVQKSRAQREKGNDLFKRRQFEDSISWYTRGGLFAPHPTQRATTEEDLVNFDINSPENSHCSSTELALSFANRSAALYQSNRFRECLSDIQSALLCGYPKELRYKLYDRRCRCLSHLGDNEGAKRALAMLAKTISFSDLNVEKRDEIRIDNERFMDNCSRQHFSENESRKYCRETLAESVSFGCTLPKIQSTTDCTSPTLEVNYNSKKGRYSLAAKSLKVGDFVVIEKPFCCVLNPERYDSLCFHCFSNRMELAVGCQQCSTVRYCSDACRQESWNSVHKEECGVLGSILESKTGSISSLALRLVLTIGLGSLTKYGTDCKSHDQFSYSQGEVTEGFERIFHLMTHSKDRRREELFQYTLLSVFLLKILQFTKFLNKPFPKDLRNCDNSDDNTDAKITRVGGCLLSLLQIISCNGIDITRTIVGPQLSTSNPEVIGLGLFTAVSLLNHSCNPTMELIFYGNTCAARAIRNIACGDEVSIDYGCVYYTTPARERVNVLNRQYFFHCDCEACVKAWETKDKVRNDVLYIKCLNCCNSLLIKIRSINDISEPIVTCEKCASSENIEEKLDSLHKSSAIFEVALRHAMQWRLQEAIPLLEKHLSLMDSLLAQPNLEYIHCQSTLKQCYRLHGNKDANV